MSNNHYTDELNLYKTDMQTDGNHLFDFDRDLNQNWDKIDNFAKSALGFEQLGTITITIPKRTTVYDEVDYIDVE